MSAIIQLSRFQFQFRVPNGILLDVPSTFKISEKGMTITVGFNDDAMSSAISVMYDLFNIAPRGSAADVEVGCCDDRFPQWEALARLNAHVAELGGVESLLRQQAYTFSFIQEFTQKSADKRGMLQRYRSNRSVAQNVMQRDGSVSAMSKEQLRDWLNTNELSDIAEYFYSNGFNGLMMMEMSEEDLKEAIPNISLPLRKRLIALLKQEKNSPSTLASSPITTTSSQSSMPTEVKKDDSFAQGMKRGAGEQAGKAVAKQVFSMVL